MAKKCPIQKNQHHVPQFLLRNFRSRNKGHIWVFDKPTERTFESSIRNIAAERHFYSLDEGTGQITAEKALSELESNASRAIEKIIHADTIATLTAEERAWISIFVAVQKGRSKQTRIDLEKMTAALKARLMEGGVPELEATAMVGDNPQENKRLAISVALGNSGHAQYILEKTWVLYKTRDSDPFYTSDNPVVLHNQRDMKPYGNLGFAVAGIEIYLPISSTRCLGFLCPTVGEVLWNSVDKYRQIRLANPFVAAHLPHSDFFESLTSGLLNGKPIELESENVEHLNSLQVVFSSRHVYCREGTFLLAKDMIEKDPRLKEGLGLTIS